MQSYRYVLCTLIGFNLLGCAHAPPANNATQVSVDGRRIIYNGALDPQANAQVASLLQQHPDIDTLVITSRGGEIGLGIGLGQLVFDHGLNVDIPDYCFSSCANYVFPAGKIKYLHRHATLGWHGGAMQEIQPETPEMARLYQAYIGPIRAKEKAFFQHIQVQPSMLTDGQKPAYAAFEHCIGWSYSREKMESYGIRNIQYRDGAWQPHSSFEGKCIFKIED
ncbi:MAG: hypothetical protein Q4G42_08070 [Neisseria sp.]|nr:hypothetical protein [Neisseria sp.]